MRVFVTGATGFIGSALVKELIRAGHQVTGLARSDASARSLIAAGAKVHLGTIEDLESLRSGAAAADGVVHAAFFHAFSHASLSTRLKVMFGGAPNGIFMRFITAALETDRRAVQTMGAALAGRDRALVNISGTMGLTAGRLGTEDDAADPNAVGGARGGTEKAVMDLAAQGIRASAVRLPPTVHGEGDHGFVPQFIKIARKKGFAAYVGDGSNRWPAVHRLDAAHLLRLVLEKGPGGGTYHGVAEQGIPFKEISGVIGRHLNVPVVSKSPKEAARIFSWLAPFAGTDNPVSSQRTQELLDWQPMQPGLLADMEQANYFTN